MQMTSSCKEFRKGKLLCYGILVEWKIDTGRHLL